MSDIVVDTDVVSFFYNQNDYLGLPGLQFTCHAHERCSECLSSVTSVRQLPELPPR